MFFVHVKYFFGSEIFLHGSLRNARQDPFQTVIPQIVQFEISNFTVTTFQERIAC